MGNVIIAGGAGALGRAVIAELSARGHKVASIDLARVSAGMQADLLFGEVDLTDPDAVSSVYADVATTFGCVDALVNVAGGFLWEPIAAGSVESWDYMYRMNVRTALVSAQSALPHFNARGGIIINMGAASALQPGSGMAPYAAAKAGVHALTQSLAEELRGRNIRVNALLPTIIDTPANRHDMPDADISTWISPESIAKVVGFLISGEAGCITGATIPLSMAS